MNVNYILNNKMCSGCGICAVECPFNCISIKKGVESNFPEIDDRCIECKKCINVCPGYSLLERIKENNINDTFSNKFNKLYVGHSINEEIRINSASGGVITSILIYLLKNNMIDGAVVVKCGSDPFQNESFFATTIDEILQSSGSRYNQVSNCEVISKELLRNKRVAFVGRPCEIEALDNFVKINKLDISENLIKISIMCAAQTFNDNVKRLLLDEEINLNSVKEIAFRGDGWPGYFKVTLDDGRIYKKPYMEVWNNYFSKRYGMKCNLCDDSLGFCADIIVGDPWAKEFSNEKKGKSLFFARTPKGNKILSECEDNNIIFREEFKWNKIYEFQKNLFLKYNRLGLEHLSYRMVFNGGKSYFDIKGLSLKNKLKVLKKYIEKKCIKNINYYK